jgi:hypothetical protein
MRQRSPKFRSGPTRHQVYIEFQSPGLSSYPATNASIRSIRLQIPIYPYLDQRMTSRNRILLVACPLLLNVKGVRVTVGRRSTWPTFWFRSPFVKDHPPRVYHQVSDHRQNSWPPSGTIRTRWIVTISYLSLNGYMYSYGQTSLRWRWFQFNGRGICVDGPVSQPKMTWIDRSSSFGDMLSRYGRSTRTSIPIAYPEFQDGMSPVSDRNQRRYPAEDYGTLKGKR